MQTNIIIDDTNLVTETSGSKYFVGKDRSHHNGAISQSQQRVQRPQWRSMTGPVTWRDKNDIDLKIIYWRQLTCSDLAVVLYVVKNHSRTIVFVLNCFSNKNNKVNIWRRYVSQLNTRRVWGILMLGGSIQRISKNNIFCWPFRRPARTVIGFVLFLFTPTLPIKSVACITFCLLV